MNFIVRIVPIAIIVYALVACSPMRLHIKELQIQDTEFTLQDVGRIESSLQMPQGAYQLPLYERYYAVKTIDGKSMVVGLFLRSEKPRIQIVNYDSLPIRSDGGCGVVHLRYSIIDKKVVAIMCGGIG